MLLHHPGKFTCGVVAAFACLACSDQSPVAPVGPSTGLAYETTLAQPSQGGYEISFLPTISGLGVVLVAYVTDAAGNPAESGTAVFQYCSLHRQPAPSTDCEAGSGSWVFWGRAGIIPSSSDPELVGHALMTYDLAPAAGTTIGFRFRYLGQGSEIANGVSAPADHTF
jgi:hypothetical protein